MKVLHINSYYAASKFYKGLYDAQISDGLNITVYVFVPEGTNFDPHEKGDYTLIRENHKKYDRIAFYNKHKKVLYDIDSCINVEDYDVMHAHSLFSNGYIAYMLNKKYGVPYIVAVRNSDVNIFFKYMVHLRSLSNKIMNNAKRIVFISEAYKDNVLSKFVYKKIRHSIEDKSFVIPNGIDDFWLSSRNEHERSLFSNKINIVFAGTIDRNKNIATTVKACKLLIARGYDIHYTVVGKIIDESYYGSFSKEPFVTYLTPKTKREIAELYKIQDIFVMPSIHETFGLVYPEAMSQGLPVIYSMGQGFDKQFPDGEVGYSVDCMSAVNVADAVEKIVSNYGEISHRCVNLVGQFDWNIITKQYNTIYKSI